MVTVEKLRNRIKNFKHGQMLIPNKPMIIQIQDSRSMYYLSISKEKIEIVNNIEDEVCCYLAGDEKVIQHILEGTIRLQDAEKFQQVHIESNFRTILLLESIFWLNRRKT